MVDALIPQLASISFELPKETTPPIISLPGFSKVDWSRPAQRSILQEEEDDDYEDDEVYMDYHC